MGDMPALSNVMVTGATGFVGRSVVRELLARGLTPVCLVRSTGKLSKQHPQIAPDRFVSVVGDLGDRDALLEAAGKSDAAIHLVGIIIARRLKGQTFARVHERGTRNVLDVVRDSGIKRYVHVSALGTRPEALSAYHRSKWAAEEFVHASGLDWTILRPSLIHGPDGEFMRLMRRFVCAWVPPVIPYFGAGDAKLQPVSVKDVAYCIVESLLRDETIAQTYPLGGPQAYSWVEFYNTCRALMPRAKHWKPLVSQPVLVAKTMAALSGPPMALAELVLPTLGMFRFDAGQVQMSQEDSTCDHTIAEAAFGLRMRRFEDELAAYGDLID